MTPEQRAALQLALDEIFGGPVQIDRYDEAIFLSVCRYQHEQTRERAAKVCDGEVERWNRGATATALVAEQQSSHLAASIRALPFEDKP